MAACSRRRRLAGDAEASSNIGISVGGAKNENGIDSTSRVTPQDPSELTRHAMQRARQALRCLPFQRSLYNNLEQIALSSAELVALPDWPSQTRHRLTARETEDLLIWLIKPGVLRRKVDSQGLTERVRLPPLGREVLTLWPETIPSANLGGRLVHWCWRNRPRW